MEDKNVDHVAIQPDLDCTWTFVFPSEAITCSAATENVRSSIEMLYETFEDFIVPTEVGHTLLLFPAGQQVPYGDITVEPEDQIDRILRNDDGVDFVEFVDSLDVSHPGEVWLPRVQIEGTKVQVTLDSGNVLASRHTHSQSYRKGSKMERDPQYDPLSIYIEYAPNVDEDGVDSSFVTYLRVKLHSDIWFIKTPIGCANRKRLEEFFNRVCQRLPVAAVHRDSNWFTRDCLENIV